MRLTKKLQTLLLLACKESGTTDPVLTLPRIEEQLTVAEFCTAKVFLGWVHQAPATRAFGHGNLVSRFVEFCNDQRQTAARPGA